MSQHNREYDMTASGGHWQFTANESGGRLDRFLAGAADGLSRSRVQGLVRDGQVTRNGAVVLDPGCKLRDGDVIGITVPEPAPAAPEGEVMELAVVFEDEHLIVVDKPAGLVVHPAAGHESGTLVNALIAHCGDSLSGIGGVRRPGIVHRLDKDTSGLIVAAKNDRAHQRLADQFKAHGADGRLERQYLALVWGRPQHAQGSINAPLARSTTSRTRIAVTREDVGRHAVTHFTLQKTYADEGGRIVASLLELRLETGRTHQIRVHLAHIGHPVMGDPVYGAGFKASASRLSPDAAALLTDLGRQALHAAVLRFEHPVTRRRISLESPLPPDLAKLERALGAMAPTSGAKRRNR